MATINLSLPRKQKLKCPQTKNNEKILKKSDIVSTSELVSTQVATNGFQ